MSQNSCLVSTDIGFYKNIVVDDDTKMHIVSCTPCIPQGPFPKDPITNRSFNSDYCFTKAKSGQKLQRFWLCFSKILGGVYCYFCR